MENPFGACFFMSKTPFGSEKSNTGSLSTDPSSYDIVVTMDYSYEAYSFLVVML